MGIGSSIFGGIAASKAMSKVQDNLQQRQKENTDWFNRRYNEDATQRADAQRILAMTQKSIQDRNKAAAASAAVTGATEESLAASKAANNEALAESMSQIALNGERRKDAVEQQYMQTKSSLSDKLNDLEMQKAENISKAVQGVADAASKVKF